MRRLSVSPTAALACRRPSWPTSFVRSTEWQAPATVSPGGVGLGLAIADRVARAHGGSVHAENRVGGGLEVVLTLKRNETSG